MAKKKTISAIVQKCLEIDPKARIVTSGGKLNVVFNGAIKKDSICSELEDYIVSSSRIEEHVYLVVFDSSKVVPDSEPIRLVGFGDTIKKRSSDSVLRHENEVADSIGGFRHIGSGAFKDLKSDASSDVWQAEAKQTSLKSIGLKFSWLDKITREARQQDKLPVLFVRFVDSPRGSVAEDDWVVIPKTVFEKFMRKCDE